MRRAVLPLILALAFGVRLFVGVDLFAEKLRLFQRVEEFPILTVACRPK